MSYFACYLMVLVAAISVWVVFGLDSPRVGMSMIVSTWGMNASCQILHPWPHKGDDCRFWGSP